MLALGTNGSSSLATFYEKELSLAVGTVLVLTSFGTILVNSFLLAAIYINPFKDFRSPPIYFIANLGLADLLTGLLVDPFYAVYDFGVYSGTRYNTILSIGDYGSYITVNNAIVTIILLSIDRSVAIRRPFFYRQKMTGKTVAIIVAISWVYSVFFSTFRLMGMPNKAYILLDTHLHVTFAFIALTCLFTFMYQNLKAEKRRNLRSITNMEGQDTSVEIRLKEIKSDKRLLVTIFFVLLTFFLCFAPYAIFIHLQFFCTKCQSYKLYYFLKRTSEPIVYLSSVINPFIYAWRHKNFRKALGWVIKCRGRVPRRYAMTQRDGHQADVISVSVESVRNMADH